MQLLTLQVLQRKFYLANGYGKLRESEHSTLIFLLLKEEQLLSATFGSSEKAYKYRSWD